MQSRGGRRGTAARLCVVPFVVVAREKKRADPKNPTPPRGRKVLQITVTLAANPGRKHTRLHSAPPALAAHAMLENMPRPILLAALLRVTEASECDASVAGATFAAPFEQAGSVLGTQTEAPQPPAGARGPLPARRSTILPSSVPRSRVCAPARAQAAVCFCRRHVENIRPGRFAASPPAGPPSLGNESHAPNMPERCRPGLCLGQPPSRGPGHCLARLAFWTNLRRRGER